MIRYFFLIAALGAAFSVEAGDSNRAFRVAIEARDAKARVFASPTAIVREGEAWSARVDGAEGYDLNMEITELPQDGHVKACGTFNSKRGNLAPCLELLMDEQGTVKVGDVSLAITVSRAGS